MMITLHRKLLRLCKVLLYEAWPALPILLALAVEFAHIATSYWADFFLYSGDSLFMVLLRQSLARKEHIEWVVSSQFNLFPEGVLYAISSLVTNSVRASLVLNGVLNVVLFYV